MTLNNIDKTCPICGKNSKVYSEDYGNRYLVKCPKCTEYFAVQTTEEKMKNLVQEDLLYFKPIENEDEQEHLSEWVKSNQDGDEPPTVSRHGEQVSFE